MKTITTVLLTIMILSSLFNTQNLFAKSQNGIDSQPYFEGFEGSTFPPNGWQRINVSGNVQWIIGYFAHTGAQAAVCAWQTAGIGEDWLITPRWNILAGDSLAFWLRPFYTGFQPDSLAVRVSTTDSNMSSFTTRILYIAEGNGYPSSAVYQRYSVSLNQFAGQGIFIAFKHMDQNGDGIFIDDVSVERQGPVGIISPDLVPDKFLLSQNYPNPFNPSTLIRFNVGKTENGNTCLQHAGKTVTELVVYDIAGRLIQTLVKEELQPGTYEVTFNGSGLNSGVYFYKLTAGNFIQTRKMLLIK
jgi:hypothetical protein